MKLKEWVAKARIEIDSLDSELIVMKALGFDDKVDLILYSEDEFDFTEADKMVETRKKGIPLAYIIGYKEFYGRNFKVNNTVLIPRPETEDIVTSVLSIVDVEKYDHLSIADIGTGSGCIATTIKLELDKKNVASSVSGVDYSVAALETAQDNADELGARVDFFRGDLLSSIEVLPDIIVANLPYVDMSWDWTSPELKYEPALALYADDGGLKLIKRLVDEIVVKKTDEKKRFLVLEADTSQLDDIINYTNEKGFRLITKTKFVLTFRY